MAPEWRLFARAPGGVVTPAPVGVTRATMVYGADKPTDDLVGVPAGVSLQPSTGGVLYLTSAPGQPIRRQRFDRRVHVQFDGSRAALGFDLFEECEFRGDATAPTSDRSLLDCTHAAAKATAVDSTFRPQTPSIWWNAINGHDFINERFLIERCVDGHGVYNTAASRPYQSGVQLLGGIARDPFFDVQPAQSDGFTHNDTLVQVQGGRGTVARGNLARAYRWTGGGTQSNSGQYTGGRVLSCVLFNNNVGDSADSLIDRNWFEGGVLPIEAAGASPTDVGDITGNRFDGGSSSNRDVNLSSGQSAVVATGNVLYDGSPARVLRNG